MKTKTVLITAMLCVCHCVGQTNVVYYGVNSNSISVAFVDTNLSASTHASIISDLQLCLQYWGKESELDLGAYELGVVGYLYNPDKCPHYPIISRFPRNLATNQTGGLALQIPKALSDAYTNAFAFAAANSNIVAAAYAFVNFVASSNFMNIASNTLPDYVMSKNLTTNQVVGIAGEILTELHDQSYYPPSILGFYYDRWGPETTNLWMNIPCSAPSYGNTVDWFTFHGIWHNGKWRFCRKEEWVP